MDDSPVDFIAYYSYITGPEGQTNFDVFSGNLGGETFTWHVDAAIFGSGKNHVYEVLITRTGVKATATIEDWTTEQMGGVETK